MTVSIAKLYPFKTRRHVNNGHAFINFRHDIDAYNFKVEFDGFKAPIHCLLLGCSEQPMTTANFPPHVARVLQD